MAFNDHVLRRLLPERGPTRVLTLLTLINTVGNGMWLTTSVLYLTRVVGMRATQVGLGLTVAAAVTLVASAPMGYFADRRGARGAQAGWFAVLAVLGAAMLMVTSLGTFIVVASLIAIADAGQRGARGALIAGAIPGEARVRARAYLRATTNVGIALGTVAAAPALAADTPLAYRLLIGANAVSFAVAAAVSLRMPVLAPTRHAGQGPRLPSLRDRPYLTFVALDGLLSMHNEILNIVLPLWIVNHTHAPRWLVSVVFLVNTTAVVLLQVRTARGADEISSAARIAARSGLFIGAACLIFAASAGLPGWAASILLIAGALAHVFGELRQAAAGWGISFGLAPAHAQGEYQAAYSMGMQFGQMAGPAVLVWLAIDHGRAGWIVMALGFVVVAAAMPPVVRWAARHRPDGVVAAEGSAAATGGPVRATGGPVTTTGGQVTTTGGNTAESESAVRVTEGAAAGDHAGDLGAA